MEGIEQFDKVIDIDQSPIGRTPRSNPATYTGVFDLIRIFLRQLRMQRQKDIKKGDLVLMSKAEDVRLVQEMGF